MVTLNLNASCVWLQSYVIIGTHISNKATSRYSQKVNIPLEGFRFMAKENI